MRRIWEFSNQNWRLNCRSTHLTSFWHYDYAEQMSTQSKSDQLLGVPVVDTENGLDISKAVHKLLVQWNAEDIVAVSTDTAGINTG